MMVKIVITERNLLFITLGIALISIGLGIYNTYSINRIIEAMNPFSTLPKTDLPSISQYNPIYGNTDNIIIFEYLDYLCPYCAMFDVETFPELEKNYINNGKVTYIVKNWIIHREEAEKLANYATCIYLNYGLKDFLEFKHSLYEALYDAAFVSKNYTKFRIAVDDILARYNVSNCLNDSNLMKDVKNSYMTDYNEALKYKLTGTPGFVILIKRDLLSENKLKNIINVLDRYKSYGLEYSIWLSNDGKYVIISFSGAVSISFFDSIFGFI